jgi:hypothetical protein
MQIQIQQKNLVKFSVVTLTVNVQDASHGVLTTKAIASAGTMMLPSSHYKKQWICVRIWVLSGHSARVSKRIMTTAQAQDVSMTAHWFGSKITSEGTKIIKETSMKFDFVDAHVLVDDHSMLHFIFYFGGIPHYYAA